MRLRISNRVDYRATLGEAWAAHLAPKSADAPTVISTFAGCGGSSLGYSMAGFRELLAAEWDDHACACLKANFPGVPVWQGDIAALSAGEAMRIAGVASGELDVLDGSPPCQGFSTAGRRNFSDSRNQLFREYVRLLRAFAPKAFIMENVSGLVKGVMKAIFAEMLGELKASGYRVRARLLDAAYFGVPQHRQRMIFVGVREDLGIEPTHPTAEPRTVSVAQAIGDLSLETQSPKIGHTWIDESPSARDTKTWHRAAKAAQGQVYAGQHRRLFWDRPSGTLTTGGSCQGYLRAVDCHPLATRVFSMREAARLASFPDEFEFGDTSQALKRIGNSVPPLLMRAVASVLRERLFSFVR